MKISIDGIIEEYYYGFLEDIDCNDNDELTDVYIYTKNKINEYISVNKEKFDDFIKETNAVKQNIANIILKDTWYHIYENICFLDTRYNLDQDIENINKNKAANAIEKNDEIDIISLKDFLDIQCKNKEHRRRYKYSLCYESEEYHNDYNIPRTCSVYVDYYSVNSELHQKRYLCKEYADIINFLHNNNINKNDIKAGIKNYSIWDIDEDWMAEINNFYKAIQNGKNNLLQYQLIERLFKFRTFLDVYSNFINEPYLNDMLIDAQPFTVLGYSFCMNFFMRKYKKISNSARTSDYAELLFNGITSTINSVLGKLLITLCRKKTDDEKQKWIRDIKAKISLTNTEEYVLISEYEKVFSAYDYTSWDEEKNITPIANKYLLILFNNKFLNTKVIEDIIPDFEKLEDCEGCEDSYEQDIVNTRYSDNFYDNLDRYNGNINAFFDSIYVETEDDDEWYILNDASYDFTFSDLLFLITKCEYKEFFE